MRALKSPPILQLRRIQCVTFLTCFFVTLGVTFSAPVTFAQEGPLVSLLDVYLVQAQIDQQGEAFEEPVPAEEAAPGDELEYVLTYRNRGEESLQGFVIKNRVPEKTAYQGDSNRAEPGDRLRYEVSFTNTGVGTISDINIYDAVPAFTELAEELDTACACTDPLNGNPLAEIPPTLSCSLIAPSSSGPDDNEPGYRGTLHWQLNGTLAPGQTGLVVFTVDVK